MKSFFPGIIDSVVSLWVLKHTRGVNRLNAAKLSCSSMILTNRGPLLLSFLYCGVHLGPVFIALQGHVLHPCHTQLETGHDTVQHTLLDAQHPVDLSGREEEDEKIVKETVM